MTIRFTGLGTSYSLKHRDPLIFEIVNREFLEKTELKKSTFFTKQVFANLAG
jgi:hypothetical protein